jgi:hypothetical protein
MLKNIYRLIGEGMYVNLMMEVVHLEFGIIVVMPIVKGDVHGTIFSFPYFGIVA